MSLLHNLTMKRFNMRIFLPMGVILTGIGVLCIAHTVHSLRETLIELHTLIGRLKDIEFDLGLHVSELD